MIGNPNPNPDPRLKAWLTMMASTVKNGNDIRGSEHHSRIMRRSLTNETTKPEDNVDYLRDSKAIAEHECLHWRLGLGLGLEIKL